MNVEEIRARAKRCAPLHGFAVNRVALTEQERLAAIDVPALLAELARKDAAIRAIHDLSLLPFTDNDRREISVRARAALGGTDE